jgi:hypothetical protein
MNRREAVAHTAWLLGGIFSAPTVQAMERWNDSNTRPNNALIAFLSESQRATLERMADLILPRTDTPGALDVGVPDFIELMIRDCYTKPVQTQFTTGLAELDRSGFLSLSSDQQTAALKRIEADAQKSTTPTFWLLAKELTLLGYYTSEAGIKTSFDYQPIPGRFEAIKIKPGQKDFMYGNQA